MNKVQIFKQVTEIETQIGELYEKLGELKDNLSKLIEENHRLTVENEHLRSYIVDERKQTIADGEKEEKRSLKPHEGLENLARLYLEGFHICSMHYGSLRADEDCLFCFKLFNQE